VWVVCVHHQCELVWVWDGLRPRRSLVAGERTTEDEEVSGLTTESMAGSHPMVLPRSRSATTGVSVNVPSAHQFNSESKATTLPATIELISGSMLCRLKVWNDQEWADLPEQQRPRDHAHVPGLGWVGAVPIAGIN
jgi:hypothetical protein